MAHPGALAAAMGRLVDQLDRVIDAGNARTDQALPRAAAVALDALLAAARTAGRNGGAPGDAAARAAAAAAADAAGARLLAHACGGAARRRGLCMAACACARRGVEALALHAPPGAVPFLTAPATVNELAERLDAASAASGLLAVDRGTPRHAGSRATQDALWLVTQIGAVMAAAAFRADPFAEVEGGGDGDDADSAALAAWQRAAMRPSVGAALIMGGLRLFSDPAPPAAPPFDPFYALAVAMSGGMSTLAPAALRQAWHDAWRGGSAMLTASVPALFAQRVADAAGGAPRLLAPWPLAGGIDRQLTLVTGVLIRAPGAVQTFGACQEPMAAVAAALRRADGVPVALLAAMGALTGVLESALRDDSAPGAVAAALRGAGGGGAVRTLLQLAACRGGGGRGGGGDGETEEVLAADAAGTLAAVTSAEAEAELPPSVAAAPASAAALAAALRAALGGGELGQARGRVASLCRVVCVVAAGDPPGGMAWAAAFARLGGLPLLAAALGSAGAREETPLKLHTLASYLSAAIEDLAGQPGQGAGEDDGWEAAAEEGAERGAAAAKLRVWAGASAAQRAEMRQALAGVDAAAARRLQRDAAAALVAAAQLRAAQYGHLLEGGRWMRRRAEGGWRLGFRVNAPGTLSLLAAVAAGAGAAADDRAAALASVCGLAAAAAPPECAAPPGVAALLERLAGGGALTSHWSVLQSRGWAAPSPAEARQLLLEALDKTAAAAEAAGLKIRDCRGCRRVGFCSAQCQAQAWPGHKAACRAAQAAREARRKQRAGPQPQGAGPA
ncbi:MAG: hypothetical protein J3K34DRAFT_499376 [Monoraphidium minutum]|nr:MAG: hypothetical protein J3K34DRAFT_499376 [Monoraphidium minutum]